MLTGQKRWITGWMSGHPDTVSLQTKLDSVSTMGLNIQQFLNILKIEKI
jgi:hypothetical protein